MAFKFICNSCDQLHEGVPTFGFDSPAIVEWMPHDQRGERVELGSDDCVVDGKRFLVRGCIEISVVGEEDPFIWGVWIDISASDFEKWSQAFDLTKRERFGPFAGYLGSVLPCYPNTFNHHVVMHLRDKGTRPFIEVSKSRHPLHLEQCSGMTHERLKEIYLAVVHGTSDSDT